MSENLQERVEKLEKQVQALLERQDIMLKLLDNEIEKLHTMDEMTMLALRLRDRLTR